MINKLNQILEEVDTHGGRHTSDGKWATAEQWRGAIEAFLSEGSVQVLGWL